MSNNRRKKSLAAHHNEAYEKSKEPTVSKPISNEAKIKAQRWLAIASALGAVGVNK